MNLSISNILESTSILFKWKLREIMHKNWNFSWNHSYLFGSIIVKPIGSNNENVTWLDFSHSGIIWMSKISWVPKQQTCKSLVSLDLLLNCLNFFQENFFLSLPVYSSSGTKGSDPEWWLTRVPGSRNSKPVNLLM